MSAFAAATSFFSRSETVLTRIGRTVRRPVTSNLVGPGPRCCAAAVVIVRMAATPNVREVRSRITALLAHDCIAFMFRYVREPRKLVAYQYQGSTGHNHDFAGRSSSRQPRYSRSVHA